MLIYISKRLLLMPFLMLLFSMFAFFVIQAPPGDFVTNYIAELAASGSAMDQAQIDGLRSLYGLDQPMSAQYLKWMGRILTGDLGISLDWQKPISELIGERLLLTAVSGVVFVPAAAWIFLKTRSAVLPALAIASPPVPSAH